jgi:hypothetical protein
LGQNSAGHVRCQRASFAQQRVSRMLFKDGQVVAKQQGVVSKTRLKTWVP